MTTARELADRLRIPNHSVIEAVQGLGHLNFPDDTYLDMIREVRGIKHKLDPIPGKHMTEYTFRYFFQDQLKSELTGLPANPDSTFLNALIKARNYIDTNSWVFARSEEEQKVDPQGNPLAKKGDKKVHAKRLYEENKGKVTTRKEWIALLIKDVGLTEAGASTYYANLKSGRF